MDFEAMGWTSYTFQQSPDTSYGRVVQAAREHFLIWTVCGEREATVSGHLRHINTDWPCVGDWIVLREGDVITDVLPRRTKLSRKEPGKSAREQILAANMDLLFIVSGLDRDYNPRRLERYLVLAHESGARPVIVLNKADLQTDPSAYVHRTEIHAPGIPVFALSALQDWGLQQIREQVRPGQTAALIGSSGAGKSTIVNRLLHQDRQRIMEVRESDAKGRHTTTRRELIVMPERWLLMDLPGLRELQLWADPEQMDNAFSDIVELASGCKFRDCTHQREPGCAVRRAAIDPFRIGNYQKLKRELAFLERKTDVNVARETRKKWKSIEKDIRKHPKRTF